MRFSLINIKKSLLSGRFLRLFLKERKPSKKFLVEVNVQSFLNGSFSELVLNKTIKIKRILLIKYNLKNKLI